MQVMLFSRAFQFGQKKFRFDSILAIESIFSIRFGNLINLPLIHWYSNSKLGVIFYTMHCVTVFVDVLHSIAFNCLRALWCILIKNHCI